MLFARAKTFSRSDTLAAAEKARAKGKKSKAIAEYRKVIAHDTPDAAAAIHGKLAPLLAETKQFGDAWKSFVLAAQGQIEKGFLDRGIAIYHQAAVYFPRSAEVWETIAKLHYERGRKADSVKVLMQGQQHFHKKKQLWPTAIRLLQQVLKVEAHNVPATLSLARLLKKSGEKQQALALLDQLAPKVGGQGKKEVLKTRFWLGPSLQSFWRWVRA